MASVCAVYAMCDNLSNALCILCLNKLNGNKIISANFIQFC